MRKLRSTALTNGRRGSGRADMLVVFDEQRVVICPEELVDLVLDLELAPQAVVALFLLFLAGLLVRALFLGILVVLSDIVDVRQTGEVFPAADGFEDGHVLVVGVVAGTKAIEDVAEGLLPLKVFLVLALERLQCSNVRHEGLV